MSFMDTLKQVKDALATKAGEGIAVAGNLAEKAKDAGSVAINAVSNLTSASNPEERAKMSLGICLVMAYADEDFSSHEAAKIAAYISTTNWAPLKTQDVVEMYQDLVKRFEFDSDIGKREVFQLLESANGESYAADLVYLGSAIAVSDDGINDAERTALTEIIEQLGLDVTDFRLDQE